MFLSTLFCESHNETVANVKISRGTCSHFCLQIEQSYVTIITCGCVSTIGCAPKRPNRTIFFDDETALILHRWVRARESRNKNGSKALFLNVEGGRLDRNGVYTAVTKAALRTLNLRKRPICGSWLGSKLRLIL